MNITEAVHPDWLQSPRFTKEAMSFDFKQVQLCLTSSESRKTDWVCPLFFSKVQNNKRLVYNMRENAKNVRKTVDRDKNGGKLYCEILTHQRAGVFGYISAYFNIRCTLSE